MCEERKGWKGFDNDERMAMKAILFSLSFPRCPLDSYFDRATRPINRRNDSQIYEYRLFNEANNEKFKQLFR